MQESQVPKPYFKTSYFYIMLGSIVGGIPALMGIAALLPHLPLSAAQGAQLLELAFNGWLWLIALTTGGNVAVRGAVTLAKQAAQNAVPKLGVPYKEIGLTEVVAALAPIYQLGVSTAPTSAPTTTSTVVTTTEVVAVDNEATNAEKAVDIAAMIASLTPSAKDDVLAGMVKLAMDKTHK